MVLDLLGMMQQENYLCVHCCSSNSSDSYAFETIESVYGHWLSNHTELPIAKPFLFYVVAMAGCYYCNYSGYYDLLKKHHGKHHANAPFVVVRRRNRQECAMCYFSEGDIMTHFQQMHDDLQTGINNPLCYSEDMLANILAIDIHKKHRCCYCGDIFETEHEIKIHSSEKHPTQIESFLRGNDLRPNDVSYIICGFCNARIEPAEYLTHVKVEVENVREHSEIFANFLKTKVVFGNGLVAFKQNLILSPYDDSNQVQALIQ